MKTDDLSIEIMNFAHRYRITVHRGSGLAKIEEYYPSRGWRKGKWKVLIFTWHSTINEINNTIQSLVKFNDSIS